MSNGNPWGKNLQFYVQGTMLEDSMLLYCYNLEKNRHIYKVKKLICTIITITECLSWYFEVDQAVC